MNAKYFLCVFYFGILNAYASSDPAYFGACFPGEKSVTQSFVVDNNTGEAFSYNLRRISKGSDVIGAVISRYQSAGGDMHPVEKEEPNIVLGHQGLSIQYIGSRRYFWSSVNQEFKEDSGNYAVRYQLDSNGVVGEEFYKLFSEKKTSQPISPAVSYDQKYLIVKMTKKSTYEIRIFDIKNLKNPGDFSENYKYSFQIGRIHSEVGPIAVQGLASDGKLVYVLMGSLRIDQKNSIEIYKINGDYVRSVDLRVGRGDAMRIDSGDHYEPEGLAWMRNHDGADLLVAIAAGDQGKRKCLIYKTELSVANH